MASGTAIAPATHDVICIELALDGKTITAAHARVVGCDTAKGFALRVAAQTQGRTLAAARALDLAALYDASFPPHKTYLVGVVHDALRAALDASSLP